MSSQADKTPGRLSAEQQNAEIIRVAKRIKLAAPNILKLSNGKECEIESDLVARMKGGHSYSTTDWTKLCDLLLSVRVPGVIISVGPAATLPALKDGETGFWIREVDGESPKSQKLDLPMWCFTVYKPSSKVITTYAVKSVDRERYDLSSLASTIGTMPHMLSSVFHQETGCREIGYRPFQDALLFDMMLDLATGDFTPHQRRIEDGQGIQLEILQALEQLQIEAKATAAARPSKRRRTIKERLADQSVKHEL